MKMDSRRFHYRDFAATILAFFLVLLILIPSIVYADTVVIDGMEFETPPPDPNTPAGAVLIDADVVIDFERVARLRSGNFPRLVQDPSFRLFRALEEGTGTARVYRVQAGGGTRPPRVIGSVPPPRRLIRIGASDYAADQILVQFKRTTSNQTVQNILANHGLQVLAYAGAIDWFVLSVPANVDVRILVQALNSNPNVQWAELNSIITGGTTPVDQYYATQQWPLFSNKLKMETAWGRTLGNSSFIIAVLDSGIKSNHEDLLPKIARDTNGNLLGFNRVTTGYPEDDHGHGTFVSGIAAAQTTFPPNPFGDGIAGVSFPGANTQVLWWDPVGQRYRQYPSSMVPRIGAGRGYWVRFLQDPPATTYTGAYAFTKSSHPVVVHLYKGWNLIGTPARNNITWNLQNIKVRYYDTNTSSPTFGQAIVKTLADASTGAISARWTEGYAWRYNPTTRQYQLVFDTTLVPSAIGQITPTEGYWFYAYVECELLLPSS